MRIYTDNDPEWLEHENIAGFVEYVYSHPTWWLNFGIRWKYFNVRYDARTGAGLISAAGWEDEPPVYITKVEFTEEDMDGGKYRRYENGSGC